MPYPQPFAPRTDRQRRLVERARAAAAVAAPHAARHDRDGTFPLEGLAALAESGYLAAVVPEAFGGEGAGVEDMALANLELAKGDASLALVVAMHGAQLGKIRDGHLWPAEVFERLCREIAATRGDRGALINSLASEPDLGSPSRGGLPATCAVQQPDGSWRLSGRKSFSTGAPALRWGIVAATVGEGNAARAANFLVPLDAPGVRVEPSWDTLGMRATRSDTLVLQDVPVPADAELPRPGKGGGLSAAPSDPAWGLTNAAVYVGVAEAARDFAVRYARERRPTALGGQPISTVPHIRRRAAELDLQLYQARAALLGVARAWDAADDAHRATLASALAAAKLTATNAAITVAEGAMRLVGGTSLDRSLPLERHYRDVRGGLHHPPQDDATLELLAQELLD